MHEPEGFREFVEMRSASLLRSAWLLTGDWHAAHDLVQAALLKTWPRWDRLVRRDRPELYVRRVILNTYLSWRGRRWNGETPVGRLPEPQAHRDAAQLSDLRLTLVAALATLPPRQRATVVLRYFDDLTEADTALALGCSVGTVKTQCSRAMQTLRTMPALGPRPRRGGVVMSEDERRLVALFQEAVPEAEVSVAFEDLRQARRRQRRTPLVVVVAAAAVAIAVPAIWWATGPDGSGSGVDAKLAETHANADDGTH